MMVAEESDRIRPALDLRQAIALRAMWCGLGWPGVVRGELEALGLVEDDTVTPAGRALVESSPEHLHVALVRMAYQLRRQAGEDTRREYFFQGGNDDGE